ncbi:MAG: nuclear transport factor 2 family protein [Anaerolineae bacterium]|nr:nuclear transport factor 2 family protein [Anaerolineae bacterium]
MEQDIQEIVDRETRAWDTQDIPLLLSVFHPDMVWPWPPTSSDHDPITWELTLGKFDYERWTQFYRQFFDTFQLIHNRRKTVRVEISLQGDGALAVVDIDTQWKGKHGEESHWLGRVCKVYAKVENEWKLIMHTGALTY